MVGARLFNPTLNYFALSRNNALGSMYDKSLKVGKYLTKIYNGKPYYSGRLVLPNKFMHQKVPNLIGSEYCILDLSRTHILFVNEEKKFAEWGNAFLI